MKRTAQSILIGFCLHIILSSPSYAQTSVSPTKSYQASGSSDQDDMAVWVHPSDFSKSTVIGSDKASGKIFVYDIAGATLQTISSGGKPGNIDLRYNISTGNIKTQEH